MSKRAKAAGGERLQFIEFQLPTLVEKPPEGDNWVHEIKYDGYRTELLKQGSEVRALTRRGFDWTEKYYGPIVAAAAELGAWSAIVDGEIVVLDEKGHADFGKLKSAMRWEPERLIFVAFDLMHLDGDDLRFKPLLERRERLAELIGDSGGAIQFSQHIQATGRPSSSTRPGSASRGWCRSGRTHPIAAAAATAG